MPLKALFLFNITEIKFLDLGELIIWIFKDADF